MKHTTIIELKVEDFNSYMTDFVNQLHEAKRQCNYYNEKAERALGNKNEAIASFIKSDTEEELTKIAQVAFKRTVNDYLEAQAEQLEKEKIVENLNIKQIEALSIDEMKSKLIIAKQRESVLLDDISLKDIGNHKLENIITELNGRIEDCRREKSTYTMESLNTISSKDEIIEAKDNQINQLKSDLKCENRKKKVLTASSWINSASKFIIKDESRRTTIDLLITSASSAYVLKDLDNWSYEITWMVLALVLRSCFCKFWRWWNKDNTKSVVNNYYQTPMNEVEFKEIPVIKNKPKRKKVRNKTIA